MTDSTRRDAIKLLMLAPAAATATAQAIMPDWPRGMENQRRADLGNGTFLNPVVAGDHPDPSVLKDGDDYYLTHSSFDVYPGLLIRHSRDLVNWRRWRFSVSPPGDLRCRPR